jgi:hypothetical protein
MCVQNNNGYHQRPGSNEEEREKGFQTLKQQVQSTTQERSQKKHNLAQIPAIKRLHDASTLRARAAGGR